MPLQYLKLQNARAYTKILQKIFKGIKEIRDVADDIQTLIKVFIILSIRNQSQLLTFLIKAT